MQMIWLTKRIPKAWQIGRIRLLDKGKGTDHPKQMRPISVLNAEGRIFFTIFQQKLASYMVDNGYINTSVQKAFIDGLAGCIEHATIFGEMLKDAKSKQRQICSIFLDLANAYGSVRHSLAFFALKWFHVPAPMVELLYMYYEGICLQVQTDNWSSNWFGLEIGVPQGCTASTIVFDVVFQMVLDIHEHLMGNKSQGYTLSSSSIVIKAPAYADDVALVEKTPNECQDSIVCFEQALDWARTLKLKPEKCKTLAFRKFVIGQETRFKRQQKTWYSSFDPLLTVYGKLAGFIGDDKNRWFKYLGRLIQFDLQDDKIRAAVQKFLVENLAKIDGLLLTGAMKAWIANFYIAAKLGWFMMIHEFPNSLIEVWDTKMKSYYRRWLGLAASTEAGILYRSNVHFGLGFKCLTEVHKQLQAIKWQIMKSSKDYTANKLYHRRLELDRKGHIGTGRRDSPCLTVERMERQVTLDDIAFSGQTGRHGVGWEKRVKRLSKRKKMVLALKKEAEDQRLLLALDYRMQTNWMEYAAGQMERKDLTWAKMLTYPPNLLKFTLNAQANTLPSPDNLRRWFNSTDVYCGLCGLSNVTLAHILCGCGWVHNVELKLPRASRFKWRHDCILATILHVIKRRVKTVNASDPVVDRGTRFIPFVKAGSRPKRRKKADEWNNYYLNKARDWVLLGDIPWEQKPGESFVFPQKIALTPLRPDAILFSEEKRLCVIIELTAPLEENIEAWRLKKKAKYQDEIGPNLQTEWKLMVITLEVGAKGWVPPSFRNDISKLLGLPKKELSVLTDDCSKVARKCSYVIWLNRFNRDFHPWPLVIDNTDTNDLKQN
jgi:hypothetical protein